MSTVNRQGNFEPVRDILNLQTRPIALADPNLMDPTNAVALVEGEWMIEDSNRKAIRATTIGSVGNEATVRSFPHWLERGRYDARAQAEPKSDWLWGGITWEFKTRIFNAAVSVGSGAPITAWMQPLKVATITLGTRNYSGLVGHGGSGDTALVVAYVSKIPVNGVMLIRGGNLY